MKAHACGAALLLLLLTFGAAPASEERYERELTCQPVNGYIRLPGILYDDLTPLAREVFDDNPAAVTNALYSLPQEERDDFINLYLEPTARERHRYFFGRCVEISNRRAAAAMADGREIIPRRLRTELQERERVRLSLHEGALPFRIGTRNLYIPIPSGYEVQEGPLADYLGDAGVTDSLAVFGKATPPGKTDDAPPPRSNILAVVRHVREGSDNLASTLASYRIMVDQDWRLASIYPPEAAVANAESVEYRWNLQPFSVRDNSFCYGQFVKIVDFHGVSSIRYRVTAVIILSGGYIQVSIVHAANTGLETVNEINSELTGWRDAILAINEG